MSDAPVKTAVDQRIAVDVPTMCGMIGIGVSTGWFLLNNPDQEHPDPEDPSRPAVESVTVGRRRLALVSSINAFIERRRTGSFDKVANPPPGKGRRAKREMTASI